MLVYRILYKNLVVELRLDLEVPMGYDKSKIVAVRPNETSSGANSSGGLKRVIVEAGKLANL